MANLETSEDLVENALQRAGEVTDGVSPFDSRALTYLTKAYKDLFSAGNEFDPDLDEAWLWAQGKHPVILTLLPAYETGTVTLTNNSRSGTFSSAPTVSHNGYFLRINGRPEYFRIRQHTASSTAFSLDQEYTEASGTFNFQSIKLEYELVDDRIVVDASNDKIDFEETVGVALVATLTHGVYSTTTIATEIDTRLSAAGAQSYTVSFDTTTRKFTIAHGGATLRFLNATGTNRARAFLPSINYSVKDLTGATTYTSEVPLNAIARLSQPMVTYRESQQNIFTYPGIRRNSTLDTRGNGQIYELDRLSLLGSYPVANLEQGIPTRYAKCSQSDDGRFSVQFNKYPAQETRVEVYTIPFPLALQDNAQSKPKIPLAYRDFLVYAACYHLSVDKSDNKAQNWFALAQQKLKALVNHNRKDLSLAGKNYARLIPRRENR